VFTYIAGFGQVGADEKIQILSLVVMFLKCTTIQKKSSLDHVFQIETKTLKMAIDLSKCFV